MLEQLLAHYVNSADAANRQGDFKAAINWSRQALQLAPDFPEALYNLGIALAATRERGEAITAFEKARLRTLESADAQNSIGLRLTEIGAYFEAELCLQRAIDLRPDFAYAHSNLGMLRNMQRQPAAAKAVLEKAISLRPDLAEAHINLSGVLSAQRDYPNALAASKQAIILDPNLPQAWVNLGTALEGLDQDGAAEEAYRRAIALAPGLSDAWVNLANMLSHQKRYGEAVECFRHSLKLAPDSDYVRGALLYAMMRICDWSSITSELPVILRQVRAGRKVAEPFAVLSLTDDPEVQFMAAQTWFRDWYLATTDFAALTAARPRSRIRIGYFSADFHDHATSQLMAELFEKHDTSRFELTAFSFGPNHQDTMRARIQAAFDRFLDVRHLTDQAIVEEARRLEIDIAVDLKGYTQDSRPGIFALRAAPTQVSYLGYPGTMGTNIADYLIADRTLIPESARTYYSEKIVYLPNSYQVNDSSHSASERQFTREEVGLPAKGFVFCCFNNNYKITPEVFDRWMSILGQVDGSVLWLFEDNAAAACNLATAAKARGIYPGRLVFAKRLPLPDHLARHQLADLFLDTSPYNAHTTASDALRMGLPVLTCTGRSFASRVAASLLNALNLPELITTDLAEYERLAVELARNRPKLDLIKAKLDVNRQTSTLYDAALFARHLETAFELMLQRRDNHQPPACIQIPA